MCAYTRGTIGSLIPLCPWLDIYISVSTYGVAFYRHLIEREQAERHLTKLLDMSSNPGLIFVQSAVRKIRDKILGSSEHIFKACGSASPTFG